MILRIGENIKRLRCQRELTQEEVAAHLGISFQSVSGNGGTDIRISPCCLRWQNILA
jgi:predicted XRE-type DNA-binding protein